MSSGRKELYQASSPHSSSAGQSLQGTPDTHLTAFTPDGRATNNTGKLKMKPQLPSQDARLTFGASGFGPADKDPFITAKPKGDQKLSPTASTFQPFGLRIQGINASPVVVSTPNSDIYKSPPTQGSPGSSAGSSNSATTFMGTFSTDTTVTRALKVSGVHGPISTEHVVDCIEELESLNLVSAKMHVNRRGGDILVRTTSITDAQTLFTRSRVSRPDWKVDYITPSAWAQKSGLAGAALSAHEGQIYLIANFTGTGLERSKLEGILVDILRIDGALYAYQKQAATESGTCKLIAEFIDVTAAENTVERLDGMRFKGILMTCGRHHPDTERLSPSKRSPPITPVRDSESSNFDLSTYLKDITLSTPKERATVNYHNSARTPRYQLTTSVAQHQIGHGHILSPTGRSVLPSPYTTTPYTSQSLVYNTQFTPVPMPFGYTPPSASCNVISSFQQDGASGAPRYAHTPHHNSNNNGWTGMSTPDAYNRGQNMTVARYSTPGRRQNAMRVSSRSPSNNANSHHNVVDISRIQEGSDVRTTIMLRNIPNKIDQAMLKGIVDETSFGLYDFMYLRIDFANNCNVGYAFINFDDPYHIINFVRARSGQKWNRFNSDKVAEVSYATIQGKDCLVQKFRNSSVMLEHPAYRPKIFYTMGYPMAGYEEPFPDPDNNSKMRRSVENAEHVGLFAPRAGQQVRDDQRRRHSQYDRGTRLAALEEFDFQESISMQHSGVQQYGRQHYVGI